MDIRRLAAPAAALAGALYLLAPAHTRAFDVYGDVLDLTQRDVRFLDGFTGPWAHTNQVPDPDFPGALGAELAVRKAIAEWGSEPHGTGRTDPTQERLGSGGSNFDAFYSGASAITGGPNGNIVSVIPGAGSTYAFTELPIGDGWRIRFYDLSADWNDAPAPPLQGPNPLDIQGVMTHEYGHALGLDHSMVPGATMGQSTSDRGVDLRSLEDDDIAGVRFLYGARSPGKPRIERYELSGATATLVGTGFHPTDNEVWLTHRDPTQGVDGTPVLVSGLPSSQGGTRVTFAVPLDAGPGSVALRVPGTGPEALSNARPFDPARPAWTPPVRYGAPGLSAAGTDVVLDWATIPSVTAGAMTLTVAGGDPAVGFATGILVTGTGRGSLVTPYGSLLVAGAVRRMAPISLFAGVGTVQLDLGATPFAGTIVTAQAWIPDGGPAGAVLSDALEIVLTP